MTAPLSPCSLHRTPLHACCHPEGRCITLGRLHNSSPLSSSPQTFSTAQWPPAAPIHNFGSPLQPRSQQPRLSLRWVSIPPPCVVPPELHNWYPFVIWECHNTHTYCAHAHIHTHSLLCSLWRGHRLFLSAHLPAADWLSEPCLWWLRHVWGSRGLKQQASQYSLNGKYKCFQFITQWTFYESSLTNFDLKWQACANQSRYPKKVLKETGNRKLDDLRFYN